MRSLKNYYNDQKKTPNTNNLVDYLRKSVDTQPQNNKSEENINP